MAVHQITGLLIVSLILLTGVNASCSSNRDCYSCIADYNSWWDYWGCRWCPLTRACHAPGSFYNDCKSNQQVTDSNSLSCSSVREPSLSYNANTAKDMAKWSSLAYVSPTNDKNRMQSVVATEFGANYRILEFLTNDCDVILDYKPCAAVVAISDEDDHLVVAFRGTISTAQLVEQILGVLLTMIESPIGGEVLRYNENTHDSLYPCIKSIVEEQVNSNPSLRISVTGHSLGGAQASLIAAHLLYDSVIPQSRLELYTFGAPRVGDKEFAYEYDRIIGNSWRITNRHDPVPQAVPTWLGWSYAYHTRREIYYRTSLGVVVDTGTGYSNCIGNEDSNCVESHYRCISPNCLKEHGNYFLSDLPEYMKEKMQSGSAPTQTGRDQCISYRF